MPPSRRRRAVLLPGLAALALLAALAPPGAAAAAPRPGAVPPRLETALPALSNFLAGAWRWLAAAWVKGGCGIDPSGLCGAPPLLLPAAPRSTGSPTLSPGGLGARHFVTQPPARPDGGCGIDPSGLCH